MQDARLVLDDLAATHALGRRLGLLLRPGDVVGLAGPLGAGKSELARAAIRARAGAEIEVPSPTFTLVQDYPLHDLVIRHADLYRINAPDEVTELDLEDVLAEGALLVEWPEHAGGALPHERLDIVLALGADAEARIARLTAHPSWAARLPRLLA